MTPPKFLTIFSLITCAALGYYIYKSIPPEVMFAYKKPAVAISPSPVPTASPQLGIPYLINLPPSTPSSAFSYIQSVPLTQISFEYPGVWGTPSASLTNFGNIPQAQVTGSLLGVYFAKAGRDDTPVFLEFTTPDFSHPDSLPAVTCPTRPMTEEDLTSPSFFYSCRYFPSRPFPYSLTNYFLMQDSTPSFYTYAVIELPHLPYTRLRIYTLLPVTQSNFPDTISTLSDYQNSLLTYVKKSSTQIFSSSGLPAGDLQNLQYFLKLVKSVRLITNETP